MHATRAGDHAIRALLELMSAPSEERVTAHALAEATRIPEEFLRKILTALSHAGILRTSRGPRGGVRLGRRPEAISLLDVVEAVEGPVILNECLREPSGCPWYDTCPAHPIWREAQDRLRQTLASATLASLLNMPKAGV
jgi:Rrf2 family protein